MPCEQTPQLKITFPLTHWRDIFQALGIDYDALTLADRRRRERRIRTWHDKHGGPIVFGTGRGAQPWVQATALVAWFTALQDTEEQQEQQRRDRAATVKHRYRHGRTGEVVPDLAGHVQRRRRAR
jgi:hypothetical protein